MSFYYSTFLNHCKVDKLKDVARAYILYFIKKVMIYQYILLFIKRLYNFVHEIIFFYFPLLEFCIILLKFTFFFFILLLSFFHFTLPFPSFSYMQATTGKVSGKIDNIWLQFVYIVPSLELHTKERNLRFRFSGNLRWFFRLTETHANGDICVCPSKRRRGHNCPLNLHITHKWMDKKQCGEAIPRQER